MKTDNTQEALLLAEQCLLKRQLHYGTGIYAKSNNSSPTIGAILINHAIGKVSAGSTSQIATHTLRTAAPQLGVSSQKSEVGASPTSWSSKKK